MAKILIAGCGYIGTQLGVSLVAAGHEVWGLRRSAAALPRSIQPLHADLTRLDSLGCLPVGIDFIFYTAGAGATDEAAYRAVYLDGVGRFLDAIVDQGEKPRRVFFTSSTAVYAQRRGEWVDEESHTAPDGFRGDLLLCGERLILASPFPSTVVRFGGIYGPGRDSLLRAVREGGIRPQSGAAHYTNRIHRDDAAGVLQHLMGLEDLDDIYLAVDNEPSEQGEVIRWLAQALNLPVPAEEPGSALTGNRSSGSKRCRNTRLLATGYRFLYPSYRDGYASLF